MATESFVNDEEEGTEEEEAEEEVRTTTTRRRKKKDVEAPIENDEHVPLFPNLDKKARNVVTKILVYKRDPPNDGYQGDCVPTATLDYIAKRFGAGIFDFHAVNAEGAILRREMNCQIAVRATPRTAPAEANGANGSQIAAERLLDRQAAQWERDSARSQDLATRAITAATTQATSYAEMIRADTTARLERDREFFREQQAQTQQFFTHMLTMQTAMHQQDMERTRAGFTQFFQLSEQAHERLNQQNNPMLLLHLFRQGMEMGRDMGGEDDDPLTMALKFGVKGMGELKDMMALSKGQNLPRLAKTNPAVTPSKPQENGEKAKKRISRKELEEVLRLKKLTESKGYSFEGMLSQAKQMVEAAPDAKSSEPDDDDEEEDSGDNGSPEVDGRESP